MKGIFILLCLFSAFHTALAQTWSPEGKTMAFFYIHAVEDIYLVNEDGTDFQIIDAHPERDFGPVWSPDGTKLLFTSVRDGNHELHELHLKTGDVRQLTSSTNFESHDGCYSPDGKKIIFSSQRKGNYGLYRIHSDGSNEEELLLITGFDMHFPRFFPDGNCVLFVGIKTGQNGDLYMLNLTNRKVTQITHTPESEFHPSLSPDGKRITYIKVADGAFQVHVANADGTDGQAVVSKQGYQAFYPNWSPDGRRIAFTRDVMEGVEAGLPALLIVDMDGNERLVTNENSFEK